MKKNGFIAAILAFTLLGNAHIQTTSHRPADSATSRLKKQVQAFKDAFACAREKGFGACTPAQKKRIVATGLAIIIVLVALGYGGVRGAAWWRKWQKDRQQETERLEAKREKLEKIPPGKQEVDDPSEEEEDNDDDEGEESAKIYHWPQKEGEEEEEPIRRRHRTTGVVEMEEKIVFKEPAEAVPAPPLGWGQWLSQFFQQSSPSQPTTKRKNPSKREPELIIDI